MSYLYTPCGHPTGTPAVNVLDLRPEYHPPEHHIYLDGPIDAPDLLPAGAVRFRSWGPGWAPSPYQQTHITTREQ